MTDPLTIVATVMVTTAIVAPVVHVATKTQIRQDQERHQKKLEKAMRG